VARHFVAVDAGTGSGRAAVLDTQGHLLACVQAEWSYTPSGADGDFFAGYEFDPQLFWGVLSGAIRGALARAGIPPSSVAGVAATSQREGCVLLDASGREVLATPSFDSRAMQEGAEIIERIGAERLYRITGHFPPFTFPLARLLWWRRRFPDRPLSSFLMISDWVTYRLSGARVAEPSNASESLLFDIEKRTWSIELAETFGFSSSFLPDLLQPGELAGRVTREAARETGLLAGTPVYVGGADSQCALLGSGALGEADVGTVIGTSAPVLLILDRPQFDTERYLWAGVHLVPDRWILESNGLEAGSAYRWLLDLVGLQAEHGEAYDRAGAEAETARTDAPVYSFLGPTIFNLVNMNPARAAGMLFARPFRGERPGRPEILRGFLESVAFAVRANVEQLQAFTGTPVRRLTASGGMMRGKLFRRLLAEVMPLPVDVSTVVESSLVGCAVLAGVGSGTYADLPSAVREGVWTERLVPEEVGRYEERYRKWRELHETLERVNIP